VAAAFLNLSACHLWRCCTFGALCCPPDVACAPAPCVRLTVHDISPGLESQLVLELESGEACSEILEILLGRRRHWFTVPLYQNLPNAASQTTRQDTGRCGHHCAVECGRERRWFRWWRPNELLKDAHMEDVVDFGVGWKL
jgi:hypothetical protein